MAQPPVPEAGGVAGLGLALADAEAAALVAAYHLVATAVARFPEAELKAVEPPLRAAPAPPD